MRLLELFGKRPRAGKTRAGRRGRANRPRLTVERLEPRDLLDASANQAFVSHLYQDLLHRSPSTSELATATGALQHGLATPSNIAQGIESGTEYRTDLVQNLYQQLLGRPASAPEVNSFVTALARGLTDEQLAAALLGSSEFWTLRGGGTNAGFVQAVYQDVLHRPVDPAGAQVWEGQLAAGISPFLVASEILTSPEYRIDLVQGYFQEFLHRSPSGLELEIYVSALELGMSDEQVIAQLVSSAEYIGDPPATPAPSDPASTDQTLTAAQVLVLLQRAAAANANEGAIIVVVDRTGQPLGIRLEAGVSPALISNPVGLTFAVDGALAEARTAAFFSSDQAPLSSRTVEFISQSTITQQMVNSNPNITDPNSPLRGPGFVAPVGVGGHFPPGVDDTPSADLFGIEQTNRDSIIDDGVDLSALGRERFDIPLTYVPPGQEMTPPESYGFISGILPDAQSRGIGTLPGGVPLYEDGSLVGGIGVFFPGTTGYATAENSILSTTYNPDLPDLSLEAEWMGYAAAGGSSAAGLSVGTLGGVAPLPGFDLPFGRIDLNGVTLPIYGPGGTQGPANLVSFGRTLGTGNPNNGVNLPLFPGDSLHAPTDPLGTRAGALAPDGWLVLPHAGGDLTAADVTQIILQGIAAASQIRAQIRLPIGVSTEMVFAVTDEAGDVLGMYRMPDATIFSEDVAVAKARNVAYYDNPAELQPIDEVPGLPPGVALTNRTFRYLAQPYFPEGIDGTPPGPMSILNDGGSNPLTGLVVGPPLPASAFQSGYGYAAFNPDKNFHDPFNPLNQNGVVWFPGSSAVYKTINGVPTLVGGFGVSGDGVNEDDTVTALGINGYQPPAALQADQYFVRGVRLPYQEFSRNPEAV